MTSEHKVTGKSRTSLAARIASDIPEGWYVNLGIGIPTLVADFVPSDREVIFHSENGILGVGPAPAPEAIDYWLVNAGKRYVSLRKGGAYFDQAESFAMIRGRHIDLCVLGAFEVDDRGNIANWSVGQEGVPPAVGGAMDLAAAAKRVWVAMEHTTKNGSPRIVRELTLPLTAVGAVSRIYTNLCVLDVKSDGLHAVELADGVTPALLRDVTEPEIHFPKLA